MLDFFLVHKTIPPILIILSLVAHVYLFHAFLKKNISSAKIAKIIFGILILVSFTLSLYTRIYVYIVLYLTAATITYILLAKKFKGPSQDPALAKLKSRKEKEDLRRFNAVLESAGKKLLFYSEKSGYFKYFEDYIDYILANSDITIHYITSDYSDKIFDLNNPKLIPYYIGEKKLIFVMMKLNVDICVMTMTDLQNFHIKRSLVRDDIEYIYVFHAPLSFLTTVRHKALDHYDTIFSTGKYHDLEIRESEKLYDLKPKKIIRTGYGVIEKMRKRYQDNFATYNSEKPKKIILIAPSWSEDNILDSCLPDLLGALMYKGWQIIVRPHPEYVKRFPDRWAAIQARHADQPPGELLLDSDFSATETIYFADTVISDWSWISYEYAIAVLKPVLFINTEMKIINPHWDKIPLEPLNVKLRSEIGIQLGKSEIKDKAEASVRALLADGTAWREKIERIQNEYLYDFGHGGEAGGKYIISRLEGDPR
jgi:YidC/Oxa1 family membrane protein insertase